MNLIEAKKKVEEVKNVDEFWQVFLDLAKSEKFDIGAYNERLKSKLDDKK